MAKEPDPFNSYGSGKPTTGSTTCIAEMEAAFGVILVFLVFLLGVVVGNNTSKSHQPEGITGLDLHRAFLRCGGNNYYSKADKDAGKPDPAIVCTQAVYGGGKWMKP